MGIMDWIGVGKDIAEPIKAVGDLYTTDKARLEAQKDLQGEINKPMLAQSAVNAMLAGSSRLFVSGWQPMIGWTAGFLILLYYAPQIMITTVLWYDNCIAADKVLPFPMKADDILNLVYLLFGFGVHHLATRK